MRSVFIFISILLFLAGCNESSRQGQEYSEGTLEYSIIYPKQLENSGSTAFLPSEMISCFKGEKVIMKIKGGFGLYKLEYISKASGDSCFTLFKLFDKKMYFPMDDNQTLFVFKELGEPHIELYKDSIKTVAGFPCKKAVISFPGKNIDSITAYYTEKIGRKKPNIHTPFEKIPGVMMEFNFFYRTLSFKVIAQKFTTEAIDDSEFCIPDGYKKSSEQEIETFITTLLQ